MELCAVVLLLLIGSTMSSTILYCPTGYCVTPKLGLTVTYTGSYASTFDCFNTTTFAILPVTALDSTLGNYDALHNQLVTSGYSNVPCEGLPSYSTCNNRGTFSLERRQCICDAGLSGPECMEIPCSISMCSNQGYCDNGLCYCYRGYSGSSCNILECPDLCNGNGNCVNGTCECYSGFTGPTCSILTCPNDCSFQGECQNNVCECDSKYTGSDCSIQKCPNNCFESLDHGFCVSGQCVCSSKWSGEACDVAQCPNKCSGHGICNTGNGSCVCSVGYTGDDCSQTTCQYDCGPHGRCIGTVCQCDSGYALPTCQPACKYNCSGQGVCASVSNGFKCYCNKGRTGEFCEVSICPADCSGHGTCDSNTDRCVCDVGFMGVDCSIPTCHNGQTSAEGLCSSNGYCLDDGTCKCAVGWRGEKCNIPACPNSCSNHGRCDTDIKCCCDAGWSGIDCSTKTCPNSCSGHGQCVKDLTTNEPLCLCNVGFAGADCSEQLCPGNCSGHGTCIKGLCFCTDSYSSLDCSIPPCNSCSGHGDCTDQQKCSCLPGWIGDACQTQTCLGYPQSECSGNGLCINGSCQCTTGFSGDDCSGSCPSAFGQGSGIVCSNRGKCISGRCACSPSWTGTDCNTKTCPSQCNGRGTCNNGTCICDVPYSGPDCEVEPVDSNTGCDCAMNCTVLCLRRCSVVHDQYGLVAGHQCYSKCTQQCLVGCATQGEPALDKFVPDLRVEDIPAAFRADSTVIPEDLKPPFATIDSKDLSHSLIQDSAKVADEDLPTMA